VSLVDARVLYVNHTAAVSGGERSLLELLGGLPAGVSAQVATPHGTLEAAVRGLGLSTTAITGTAGSLRLHPLHTPVTVGQLTLAAAQVSGAARRHRAQIVHANSIRAGIVVGLARTGGAAKVVHVRDCLPPGALSTATLRLISATATTIVANSRYTADSVLTVAPDANVEVVHNGVDLARFDPQRIDRERARASVGAADGELLLGVVAQLTPWKGQDTAVEALKLAVQRGVDARLLLIGSAKFVARATRFDNDSYVAQLRRTIAEAALQERVSWLGEREDVAQLMRALDILLLPSWEEPFGRAVIEAMALRVPVIATSVGGPAEIVTGERGGVLVPPREPARWAAAIERLAGDPRLREQLGQSGRERVEEDFSLQRHVTAMLDVYERALSVA
jgi:L-malate glycosyltransferase